MAQQQLSRTLQISRAMLSLYRESRAPVEVILPELIDNVLLLLERKIKHAGIQIERQYQSPGHVFAFPGEIRQVFTNVFANATEDGEPGTVVEVVDNGPGVDPLVAKKLFQPFVTTKGEKGTGLGLWVSLGIVQKHGGTMQISNVPDHAAPRSSPNGSGGPDGSTAGATLGACVRIYLPAQYDGGIPTPASGEETDLVSKQRPEEAAGSFPLTS